VDCDRLADAILEACRTEALVPAKKLQGATLDAFKAIEAEIEAIEEKVKHL